MMTFGIRGSFQSAAAALLAAVLSVQTCSPASAQTTAPARTQAPTFTFDIPAGDLSKALLAWAETSGYQYAWSDQAAQSLQSPGVSGRMSAEAALQAIIAGTGATYLFSAERTVTIRRAVEKNQRVLGPVRVEGAGDPRVAGVNGSTDPTATEGTGSYTSSALSVASKAPRSMKETPRSVSVITQQRLQDQNLTDFSSMMNQATGITLVTGNDGPLATTFYSRGFEVENIKIDGGAPLFTGSIHPGHRYLTQIDMSMYDHVELLRGAAGQLDGYGKPGGSVNLTRKRPLDHRQLNVEWLAGSWNHSRVMVDATAPLLLEGRVRGRAVFTSQDNDYFYDVANTHRTTLYGVLETDLGPNTVARAGLSRMHQDAVPFLYGLPRYQDGDDLKLPRDTCLCFSWNRWSIDTDEVFAQLERRFGDHWSAQLQVTRNDQSSRRKNGFVVGPVNPTTNLGPNFRASMNDFSNVQQLVDANVSGSFVMFGQRQQVTIGANYQEVDGGGYTQYASLVSNDYVAPSGAVGRPPVDVLNFNRNAVDYAEPRSSSPTTIFPVSGQKQWGAHATLRLTLLEPLHVETGLRYSHFESMIQQQELSTSTGQPLNNPTVQSWSGHDLSWPPTYAVIYDLTPALSIYGSYADIYMSQAHLIDAAGNTLGPVTGSNFEGGLKWEGFAGALNATLSGFRVEQQNFSQFVDYGPYQDSYGDTGDGVHWCCYDTGSDRVLLSHGADLEITGQLRPNWQLSAGYTWNVTDNKGADSSSNRGKPLVSRAPEHMLKLWTSYRFERGEWLRRLTVAGGLTAQTRSYNSGSACIEWNFGTDANGEEIATCTASADYEFTQSPYVLLSARASYQIDSRWSVALNVENLTDRTYYRTMGDSQSGNWYGDPRSFMLTLRGTF